MKILLTYNHCDHNSCIGVFFIKITKLHKILLYNERNIAILNKILYCFLYSVELLYILKDFLRYLFQNSSANLDNPNRDFIDRKRFLMVPDASSVSRTGLEK